jgi:N-acetylneuraminic acid mutarotase
MQKAKLRKVFVFIAFIITICLNNKVYSGEEVKSSLSLEERMGCQLAIEKIYWNHRIWPKENKKPKPSIDAIINQEFLKEKVEDVLRKSNAIEHYLGHGITGAQMQAEINRIVRNSKQPKVLKELFEALGNDPHLIAECLVRPILADKILRNIFIIKNANFKGANPAVDLKGMMLEKDIDAKRIDAQAGKKFEQWWYENKMKYSSKIKEPRFDYYLPEVNLVNCVEDTWDDVSWVPLARSNQVAVWTGTEMIIWSGLDSNGNYLNSGGKYDPAIDSWRPISIMGAPMGRINATAVWTGTEMIVWGGNDAMDFFKSGGRYNPVSDTWTSTSQTNAPSKRIWHAAVWTGSEMIIWGGYYSDGSYDYFYNDGARYNPVSNSWTQISVENAPTPRCLHSFVWSGTKMLVWGGYSGLNFEGDGGIYDPVSDSWSAINTEGAPSARWRHSAVWTGTEMIVWGGQDDEGYFVNTGGRYDPMTDTWTATSVENAPEGRYRHTAVWTGTEMIIWGGFNGGLPESGGRYDPLTDTWTLITTENAPLPRLRHTAVWTGTEMIVWGGFFGDFTNTGGRYNPADDVWISTFATDSPSERWYHTAVWTGVEMIIWGGADSINYLDTGSRYYPATDTWISTSLNAAPAPRWRHTAVWTGQEMIIWGGSDGNEYLFTGARYNPIYDKWIPTSLEATPSARQSHTAVWTGTKMVIWGGEDGNNYLNTGAKYDPVSDTWTDISTINAPSGRTNHTAIYTNSEMIIWGGFDGSFLNTGGRYNPQTDSWQATSLTDAPSPRYNHTAIWVGDKMVIWGGSDGMEYLNTGGFYSPETDVWSPTTLVNAPSGRELHTAFWTGSEMVIWGGNDGSGCVNTGAKLHVITGWSPTSTTGAPAGRCNHTAVLTGTEMIVWGGVNDIFYFDDGGRYCISQNIPMLKPHNLIVDDTASNKHNGIVEPDELVSLIGSLTNVSSVEATSISGEIFTYDPITIIEATANYPDIAAGDTQSCTDCYSITAPKANRPSQHWDITITEMPTCPGCNNYIYSTHFHIGESFNDVPPNYVFYKYIETLFHNEITSGCNNTDYCPANNVARQAMAKFICISMDIASPGSCFTFGCSEIFGDVSVSNPFCEYIEALYNAGVVSGCQENPLLYCPTNNVSRQAMAKFICNAMNAATPGSCPTQSCQGIFTDVPASNLFCSYIEALYNGNIISGCAPSLYCPTWNVSRGQMAKFIVNAFNLSL